MTTNNGSLTSDEFAWVHEFPGAVTVCDAAGIVLAMNAASARVFEKDGGRALIGRSLVDCHPEPARGKLLALLRERRTNAYTIEKRGVRKLIYQTPWTRDGAFAGLVEISLDLGTLNGFPDPPATGSGGQSPPPPNAIELPAELPHFVRG